MIATENKTEAEKWLESKLGCLPKRFSFERMDFSSENILTQYYAREEYIEKFGFAILNQETVEALKKYAPILEVGAGSGYWAYELKKAGIDIVATDTHSWKFADKWKAMSWIDVEKLNAIDSISKYPGRALLFVWPSYDEQWAEQALNVYEGNTVIYVGESYGGCTANDEFHAILDNKFEEIEEIDIPQFDGIHDRLRVYKRLTK